VASGVTDVRSNLRVPPTHRYPRNATIAVGYESVLVTARGRSEPRPLYGRRCLDKWCRGPRALPVAPEVKKQGAMRDEAIPNAFQWPALGSSKETPAWTSALGGQDETSAVGFDSSRGVARSEVWARPSSSAPGCLLSPFHPKRGAQTTGAPWGKHVVPHAYIVVVPCCFIVLLMVQPPCCLTMGARTMGAPGLCLLVPRLLRRAFVACTRGRVDRVLKGLSLTPTLYAPGDARLRSTYTCAISRPLMVYDNAKYLCNHLRHRALIPSFI